jgi:hypothetical protein
MSKILSKDGKIAQSGSRVLDWDYRSCCCDPPPYEFAYKLQNCCDTSEHYFVKATGLGVETISGTPNCVLFREDRGCFRVNYTNPYNIETLLEQGVEVLDEPIGECVQERRPEPGDPPPCANEQCPACDLFCCKTFTLPNCYGDRTGFLRCNVGAKYRFRYTYRVYERSWGALGGEHCVTGVDTPPDAYCPSQCFHVYRDTIWRRTYTRTFDGIIERTPAPWGTPCLEIAKTYTLTDTIDNVAHVSDGFTFTNMQNGMPTVDSQIVYINERLEPYYREQTFTQDDEPYVGFTSPIWFCLSTGQFDPDNCCNKSIFFDGNPDRQPDEPLFQRRDTIRSEIGCLSGYSFKLEETRTMNCLGSLPPRIVTGLKYYEKEESFGWNITPLPSDYCPTLENLRGALPEPEQINRQRNGGHPLPEIPQDPEALKWQRNLTKGCHKCRASFGL